MNTPHLASPGPAADACRTFASIELSKSTWIVTLQLPTTEKVSVVRIAGANVEQLFALIDRARDRVGHPVEICTCARSRLNWLGSGCAISLAAGCHDGSILALEPRLVDFAGSQSWLLRES